MTNQEDGQNQTKQSGKDNNNHKVGYEPTKTLQIIRKKICPYLPSFAISSIFMSFTVAMSEDSSRINPCFITVETEGGCLEKYQIDLTDEQFTINPRAKEERNSIINIGETLKLGRQRVKPEEKDEKDCFAADVLKELSKPTTKRLIAKGGQCNVHLKNVPKRKRAFIKDIFTTAIDMPWRFAIAAFSLSFLVTWLLFALIWWILAYFHGDLEPENLPGGLKQSTGEFVPCVKEIYNFASCYLFSVETQHTIGYGSRQTTEECPLAIVVMSIQSILGVLISSCMAGIVFAKLARPKHRSHTVIFSKNAVISLRNGSLYLIFRIGNLRKSQLIESHVRALMVHARTKTEEGETTFFEQQELKISTMTHDDDDRTMMILPCSVFHKIDSESPFFHLSPKDILDAKFELVISLEGIVEPTGNSVQARTSYLPREVLWGYRFENMVSYASKPGTYVVDCSYLNSVVQDATPRLSMQEIEVARLNKETIGKSIMAAAPRGRFLQIPVEQRTQANNSWRKE